MDEREGKLNEKWNKAELARPENSRAKKQEESQRPVRLVGILVRLGQNSE